MPLGPEDIAHKSIANQLRRYEAFKLLKCVWWSYDASGELRSKATGSLLKSKGLRPGKSDYEFRVNKNGVMHHIYIEIKIKPNPQLDSQKIFQKTCENINNNQYYLITGTDYIDTLLKVEEVLKKEDILM